LEYPHYTRPQVWKGRAVPEVLVSGNHERIRAWRLAQAEEMTRRRRPDLWAKYEAARNRSVVR
jgi:tRNA (guanine37-N1)-methyltransferase